MDIIKGGYIPLDKSWIIRMGVLDLLSGYDDCVRFLEQYGKEHPGKLSGDLQALYRASLQWESGEEVDVGESRALYRMLKRASEELKLNKTFVRHGTLEKRKLGDEPENFTKPLHELAALPTSQLASAYVLVKYAMTGEIEVVPHDKPRLQDTYDAILHWKKARSQGEVWQPIYDDIILTQASAYLQWLKEGRMDFVPWHAEDYCFARAFGIMSAQDGEKWPNLKDHESDRVPEMEQQLQQIEVTSKDHRVVQAIAMLRKSKDRIKYPLSVNKSWPQFWRFFEDAPHLSERQ